MANVKTVPLSSIRENPVALRTVNRECEEYQGLLDSMRAKGFIGAIIGREKTDEAGDTFYEIVDGLHRYSAAKDLDLPEISVDVQDLTDTQVLEAQIMMNIHRIETRPVEYTKQLRKILKANPDLTEAELASNLGKSTKWLQDRLGLTKLDTRVQELVDDGKINLSNAYALAKLGPDDQVDFIDRAVSMPQDEFKSQVNARVKEVREARQRGEDAPASTFEPRAFLQKVGVIKDEMESGAVGSRLTQGLSSAEEGFRRAVEWVLHLDPESVEEQRVADEARRRAREEAKKERLAKKAREKAEKLAKAQAEAAAVAAELEA